jgi:hypothetical protein
MHRNLLAHTHTDHVTMCMQLSLTEHIIQNVQEEGQGERGKVLLGLNLSGTKPRHASAAGHRAVAPRLQQQGGHVASQCCADTFQTQGRQSRFAPTLPSVPS